MLSDHDPTAGDQADPSDLTNALLREEASRLKAQQIQGEVKIRADTDLPGVGDEQIIADLEIAEGNTTSPGYLSFSGLSAWSVGGQQCRCPPQCLERQQYGRPSQHASSAGIEQRY